MQHNSGGTSRFTKMVHADFFGEDGDRSSHHSHLENQCLQLVDYDEDTGHQNGKPSTLTPTLSGA